MNLTFIMTHSCFSSSSLWCNIVDHSGWRSISHSCLRIYFSQNMLNILFFKFFKCFISLGFYLSKLLLFLQML